jgi:hypothetical protein
MPLPSYMGESFNVLVQLAASMRLHKSGGLVLMVPAKQTGGSESIVQPVKYPVIPAYGSIDELMKLTDWSVKNWSGRSRF